MNITLESDDINPSTVAVIRGDQHLGVISDEGDWGQTRGRFAAWSAKAQRRDGMVGFFHTQQDAVDAITALWPAPVENESEPENLVAHTGVVHAPGRYYKQIRGNAPKCCASVSAVMRMHYLASTTRPVTCKRCLAALAQATAAAAAGAAVF